MCVHCASDHNVMQLKLLRWYRVWKADFECACCGKLMFPLAPVEIPCLAFEHFALLSLAAEYCYVIQGINYPRRLRA